MVPNGTPFFATMLGTWKDPFGAKGVALTNVSLEVGSDFEGVPSIGITGGLQIGAFAGKAAVSFNSEFPTQSVLIVAFNHLSLMDVIGTLCPPSVAAGIPADVGRTLAGLPGRRRTRAAPCTPPATHWRCSGRGSAMSPTSPGTLLNTASERCWTCGPRPSTAR